MPITGVTFMQRCFHRTLPLLQTRRCLSTGRLRVLGIETSCDDTAVALLDGHRILAESSASQFGINASYGGVVPHLAARAHGANLPHVLSKVLSDSGCAFEDIDAVAVTSGPGLLPCLKVGVEAAKEICLSHGLPLISVNHLLGHSLVSRMQADRCDFPYLLLLVSGGHCNLTVARGVDDYKELGATLDDSVGEAFDKVARELGLESESMHFGRVLEQYAAEGDPRRVALPVPLLQNVDCNFSFSGLKSAVVRAVQEDAGNERKQDIAAAFQATAVKHIVQRTLRALILLHCPLKDGIELTTSFAVRDMLKTYRREVDRVLKKYGKSWRSQEAPPSTLVVSGGVAANNYLRQELEQLTSYLDLSIVYPPVKLCTDNGVMIAWAGVEILRHYGNSSRVGRYFRVARGEQEIRSVDIRANWPLSNDTLS